MSELVLVIGPCGAGKTTYARAHYPRYLHPDAEILMHTFFATPERFRFYAHIRTCGALLVETATRHVLAKQHSVCLTIGGATRKERMKWSDLAFDCQAACQVIRLMTDAATCIARAKADATRPASSKSSWQESIAHWFRDFEPVDVERENLASYEEVCP